MNILFVNTEKGPGIYGVERWMLNLAETLLGAGHRVTLAGRPKGSLQRASNEKGIAFFPFRIRSGLEWFAALRLRQLLCHNTIEAICVKGYRELRVAWLARVGLPVQLFIRRGAMGDVKDRMKDRILLSLCADAIIVSSAYLRSEVCRIRWVQPAKVHVLRLGVNLEDYSHIVQQYGQRSEVNQVVYVGRLLQLKGTDVLLKAWPLVQARLRSARLVLVGDGNGKWRDLVRTTSGSADSVNFVGFQDDPRPWIAQSDLLVLPSLKEGAGQVLVEAMALAKPVVASNVGGIPDYILDGRTGILVPPGDERALANAIIELLSSPERLRAMGLAGRRRAEAEFDARRAAERFVSLVRNRTASG
ncbi:MAG: glycosyltransferase family 4 protein [Kiritimatiellia bacterium]